MHDSSNKAETDGSPGEKEINTAHPNGHFYSPVVDPAELLAIAPTIWPPKSSPVLGIDFNSKTHEVVLDNWFPRHMSKYDYPEIADEHCDDEWLFYTQNSQFSWLDSGVFWVYRLAGERYRWSGSQADSMGLAGDMSTYCGDRFRLSFIA